MVPRLGLARLIRNNDHLGWSSCGPSPYLKERFLAVGSPLPLVFRPEPRVVPLLPATLPLLEEVAVPGGGTRVADLSDPFDDVGGLSKNIVSFVLGVVRLSRSVHRGIGMPPHSRIFCAALLT